MSDTLLETPMAIVRHFYRKDTISQGATISQVS